MARATSAVARRGPRRHRVGPRWARPARQAGDDGRRRRARPRRRRRGAAGAASVFGPAAAASGGAGRPRPGRPAPGRAAAGAGAGRGVSSYADFLDVAGRLAELADALAERLSRRPGSWPGPRTRRAITRMMTSSGGADVRQSLATSGCGSGRGADTPAAASRGRGYDSTGSLAAHSRAAAARRSPGSAGSPSRRSPGGPRDAPRDVDEQATARPPARPAPPVAGPAARTGGRVAALGADARGRGTRARARGAGCAASSAGAVAPTTRPGPLARARPPRRGGRPAGGAARPGPRSRVGGDHEVLELAGARVGGPAEDVGEAVGARQERLERPEAQVRVDGHGVGAERVEEGDGLARDGRLDVAALGVGDDRDARAGSVARTRSRAASPALPNASKKARLGLMAAASGAAASTSRRANALHARQDVRREAGRERVRGRGRSRGTGPCRRRPSAPASALKVTVGHGGRGREAPGVAAGIGDGGRGGRRPRAPPGGRELRRRGR